MKISEINLKLSSNDVMSMIDDFVAVPGLTVEGVNIGNELEVKGKYKKIISINFKATVSLIEVQEDRVKLKLKRFSVLRLPIFKWIINIILKTVLKDLRNIGIEYEKGVVMLMVEKLLKLSPIRLALRLNAITLGSDEMLIQAKDINIGIKNGIEENKENEVKVAPIIQSKKDKYTEIRGKMQDKIPWKFSDIAPYIMLMPDLSALFVRLFKDSRVPIKTKIICAGAFAYVLSPLDLVPDFVPVLGEMDDLGVVFYALNKMLNDVPENIIIENWQGKEDIIKIIRSGVLYINNITSKNKISSILKLAKEKIKNRKNGKEEKTDA